jgi:biotin transport system substrate-specific component
MLRSLPQTRDQSLTYRITGIAVFTIISILSARVTIEIGLVPFTLQPLAVLLSGMILGGRDGVLSQLAYVALIAAGLPFDARALGTAALFGPTGGYLIGFIFAAGIAGLLDEYQPKVLWQRWLAATVLGLSLMLVIFSLLSALVTINFLGAREIKIDLIGIFLVALMVASVLTYFYRSDALFLRWLAGIAGVAMIYLFGIVVLKLHTGLDWDAAWTAGVAPFIVPDLAKALIAAALTESGRRLLTRQEN